MKELAVVVLNGGQSRRFGSDKWRHRIDNTSLLDYALRNAYSLSNSVYLSVYSPKQAEEMQIELAEYTPEILQDDTSFVGIQGPLRGILTAIDRVPADHILFLPIDYPFLTTATLSSLFERVKYNSVECATFQLEDATITGTVLCINRQLTLRRLDSINKLSDSRLTGLYRSSLNTEIVRLKGTDVEFTHFNTLQQVTQTPVPSSPDNTIIIRPKAKFSTYLTLQQKGELLDRQILKDLLHEERAIWEGIEWVTRHIDRDLQQLEEK
ncbi:MAG: NTP transferase domain-containing protein [Candidatus Kariarchaeaceae archaeon]|jgi:molybdopterin-guanine dinucleotide biosynthesis protein A